MNSLSASISTLHYVERHLFTANSYIGTPTKPCAGYYSHGLYVVFSTMFDHTFLTTCTYDLCLCPDIDDKLHQHCQSGWGGCTQAIIKRLVFSAFLSVFFFFFKFYICLKRLSSKKAENNSRAEKEICGDNRVFLSRNHRSDSFPLEN